MPDVANNANDLVRRLAERALKETLAEWVFAGEVEPREFIADQDDFCIVAHFRLGEVAAFEKRDSHGADIVVIDIAYISVLALPGSRLGASLDFEREVRGLSG